MTPVQHAAIIRTLEKPMADAYLAEVRAVESQATLAEVERLLRENDGDGLYALLTLGAMSGFLELFRAAFMAGATNQSVGYTRFDSNTWAVMNLLMNENRIIRDTSNMDLRKSINRIRNNGQSIRNQALDLIGVRSNLSGRRSGGVVGLPIQMTEWVQSAREQLLSGDRASMRAYLTRKLRDTSFDKLVVPGNALNLTQANMIARAYADKLVRSYAKQLSETYAAIAYNSGRNHAIRQMIDNGTITQDQVEKRWRTMRDEQVRHSHATMQGQRRGFTAPFNSGLGSLLMFPGDQSLGARDDDIYNCRCSIEYTIRRRF